MKTEKVNKGTWYGPKSQRQQVILYKFFVEKKGLTIDQLIECCDEYCKLPHKSRRNLLDPFFIDFDMLICIVSEKTGIQFKKRKHRYNTTEIDNRFSLGDF